MPAEGRLHKLPKLLIFPKTTGTGCGIIRAKSVGIDAEAVHEPLVKEDEP